MACGCGKNKAARQRYTVQLPGGLKITKSSEADAEAYVKSHPGSKLVKAAS